MSLRPHASDYRSFLEDCIILAEKQYGLAAGEYQERHTPGIELEHTRHCHHHYHHTTLRHTMNQDTISGHSS